MNRHRGLLCVWGVIEAFLSLQLRSAGGNAEDANGECGHRPIGGRFEEEEAKCARD